MGKEQQKYVRNEFRIINLFWLFLLVANFQTVEHQQQKDLTTIYLTSFVLWTNLTHKTNQLRRFLLKEHIFK